LQGDQFLSEAKEDLIQLGIEKGLIKIEDNKIEYIQNGKKYVYSDPEEVVRAEVYVELVEKYKYPPKKIDFEVLPPRREPKLPSDIIVFEDDGKRKAYICVEVKQKSCTESDIEVGLREGIGNSNLFNARYFLFDCRKFRKVTEIKTGIELRDIPINYGKVPVYKFKKRDKDWDLKAIDFNQLSRIFQKSHDILWAGGKRDPSEALDEMSKLIFAKIYDERNTKNGEFYKFQIGTYENEIIVAERIRLIYEEIREKESKVFFDKIKSPDDKIFNVVQELQSISLIKTDLDSKGRAFEQFLSTVFRGKLGQYFTRREIVEFMVNMVNPTERDIVVDPACGSGGFLLYCLKKVSEDIKKDYEGDVYTINRKIYDFGHYNLYGIEINDKISRVSMMDMIVHEDGHTNIENNTALNNVFDNKEIKFNQFTILLTNPPFGDKVKEGDRDKLGTNALSNFTLASGKNRVKSEILFIEQSWKFLKDEGTIGIVLPAGVITNPKSKMDKLARNFIKNKFKIQAIIGIPHHAFRKSGSNVKTNLFFLKKLPEGKSNNAQDLIFIGVAKHIGYDAAGRPDSNVLPDIFEQYKEYIKSPESYKGTEYCFSLKYEEIVGRLDADYYYNIRKYNPSKLRNYSKLIKFADVIKENFTPSPTEDYTHIALKNIDAENAKLMDVEIISGEKIKGNRILFKKGDILFARIEPSVYNKKTVIVPDDIEIGIGSTELYAIRPKEDVDKLYLLWMLRSDETIEQIEGKLTGSTGRQRLSETDLEDILIPDPSDDKKTEIITLVNIMERQINDLNNKIKQIQKDTKQKIFTIIKE